MMINTDFNLDLHEVTLFCFPYAGAGASIFASWLKQTFSLKVAIVPIQLPGREEKIAEQAYIDMKALVNDLAIEMRPWMRRPFAFFGHCMGALIAYDLSHKLYELYGCLPVHLFVSACPAPHQHHVLHPMHQLAPEDFLKAMEQISTTTLLTTDKKVANILFPGLKADFMLYENYQYTAQDVLPVNITTFRGQQDHYIPEEKLTAWHELSIGDFIQKEFVGDHLYLHTASVDVIAFMMEVLNREVLL